MPAIVCRIGRSVRTCTTSPSDTHPTGVAPPVEKTISGSCVCVPLPMLWRTMTWSAAASTRLSPSRSIPFGAAAREMIKTGRTRVPCERAWRVLLSPPLAPPIAAPAIPRASSSPAGSGRCLLKKVAWRFGSRRPTMPDASMSALCRSVSMSALLSRKERVWRRYCPSGPVTASDRVWMAPLMASARCSWSCRLCTPETRMSSWPGWSILRASCSMSLMSTPLAWPGVSGLKTRWSRSTMTGTSTRCAKSSVSSRTSGTKMRCTAETTSEETWPLKCASRRARSEASAKADSFACVADRSATAYGLSSGPTRGKVLGDTAPSANDPSRP
mmetsp:Transcript_8755/g.28799  ORF Transcript_8755/g.28799 Transcript_8755/m.28799 type:complete len:329 (-) Transcript_8755:61-1047(-)